MAVYIPDFKPALVRHSLLEALAEDRKLFRSKLHESRGLARLLLSDAYARTIRQKKYVQRRLHDESSANCDYNPRPWSKDSYGIRSGSLLETLFAHLLSPDSMREYPEQARRYVRLLADARLLFVDDSFDDETDILNELGYTDEEVDLMLDAPETLPDRVVNYYLICLENIRTNSLKKGDNKFLYFKTHDLRRLEYILHMDTVIYSVLECVAPCCVPCDVQWKTTNPSEQISEANCSDNASALVLNDQHIPRSGAGESKRMVPKRVLRINKEHLFFSAIAGETRTGRSRSVCHRRGPVHGEVVASERKERRSSYRVGFDSHPRHNRTLTRSTHLILV